MRRFALCLAVVLSASLASIAGAATTVSFVMRRFALCLAVVLSASLASIAGAATTVTLPADWAPQNVITDVLTNTKDYVLIGGIAVVGIAIVIALIRGIGRKLRGAVR